MSADRIVVTGLGVVAPNGTGAEYQWKAALARQSGIGTVPAEVAGSSGLAVGGIVVDFDAAQAVSNKVRVQTDRWTWFCLAAAQECLAGAELDPGRTSVVTSSSTGGNVFGQRELQALWSRGPATVSTYQSIAWFYAASAGQLSIQHGLTGRCCVTVADGAGGLVAAGTVLRMLRADPGQRALLAGGEAPFSPYSMVCHRDRADLSRGDRPDLAYRPFHSPATGGALGEGGVALLVETAAAARDRGASTVYAEIASVACTHDAHHQLRPPATADSLVAAISLALRRAQVPPDRVDVVFADGNGAQPWDELEVAALRECFGRRLAALPVTVPKSLTGRLNSAAGLLDLAWAAQSLAHDTIPPSAMCAQTRPTSLDLVTEPVFSAGLSTALVISRGTGGFNAAAVLKVAA